MNGEILNIRILRAPQNMEIKELYVMLAFDLSDSLAVSLTLVL